MLDGGIKALLRELKHGIEAEVVGLIDGARGWLHASSERSSFGFWASFHDPPCLQGVWDEWDRELLASGSAGIVCRCGEHAVRAVVFSKRWILIVMSDGPLVAGADTVIEHAINVLKGIVPTASEPPSTEPPAEGGSSDGGEGPAELGIPIAWIRKVTSD